MKVPTNPNDGKHEIMALADNSWGRGADAKAAREELRCQTGQRVRKYTVVPKGANIDVMGDSITWKLEDHGKDRCEHCTF